MVVLRGECDVLWIEHQGVRSARKVRVRSVESTVEHRDRKPRASGRNLVRAYCVDVPGVGGRRKRISKRVGLRGGIGSTISSRLLGSSTKRMRLSPGRFAFAMSDLIRSEANRPQTNPRQKRPGTRGLQERCGSAVIPRTNDQDVGAANEVLKPRTGWYDRGGRDSRSVSFGARLRGIGLIGRARE